MKAPQKSLSEVIGERFHAHYRLTGNPRDVVTSGEIYRVLSPLHGRCPKLDVNQWLSRRLRAFVNADWTASDRRGVFGHGRGAGGCRVFCGLQRRDREVRKMGDDAVNLLEASCDLLLFAEVACEEAKQPSVLSGMGRLSSFPCGVADLPGIHVKRTARPSQPPASPRAAEATTRVVNRSG